MLNGGFARRMLAACYACAAAAACRGATNPNEGGVLAARALVFGQVTEANGAPLGRAKVRITALPAGCAGLPHAGDSVATDPGGRYRARLTGIGEVAASCLRVVATTPLTARRDSAVVQGPSVRFQSRVPLDAEDSVRVDLRFP